MGGRGGLLGISLGLVLACSPSKAPSVTDAAPDAGPTIPIDVACEDYFAATLSPRCGGQVLEDTEKARRHDRWMTSCRAMAAWPGSGLNGRALEVCASAFSTDQCSLPDLFWCQNVIGSLPPGAPCISGMQCVSGACVGTAGTPSPGGTYLVPPSCGTCGPELARVGEPCLEQTGCVAGARCVGPPFTCVALREGDVGETCDASVLLCRVGLYCDRASATFECAAIGKGAGERCINDDPSGCAPPLMCMMVSPPSFVFACSALLPKGSPCYSDWDCERGLGCASAGMASERRCSDVTWVEPGGPCSEFARCRLGACQGSSITSPGTCTSIIPDGQPCALSDRRASCDVYSECFQGTCTLQGSFVCR